MAEIIVRQMTPMSCLREQSDKAILSTNGEGQVASAIHHSPVVIITHQFTDAPLTHPGSEKEVHLKEVTSSGLETNIEPGKPAFKHVSNKNRYR